MKLRYLFTSAIAFMTLLSGCMKDEIASLDGLSAEPSYVSLGLEAGTKKCVVKANAAWTLEKADDASWLTIDPMSGEAGTVEVTFTMEATETPRKTEVMLVSGGKTQIITVGQNGELEMTIISCDEFNAAAEGPSYYVEGFITKVEKYDYGNLWIKDDKGGEMYVYGVLDADGQSQNFKSLGIDVGDKVILYGPRTSYNGSPQMKNATLIEVTIPAVFDLNFRAIREMYNEANPDKKEEYSKYTKDDWKNLLKADLQDLQKEGGEIKIPYTFKGESFEIDPAVEWIRLKGIAQSDAGYVATLTVDPYNEDSAPRTTTLVLKGKTTVNKVVKESNLELPILQYGNMPAPIPMTEALAKLDQWLSVSGVVTAKHSKGFIVTDAAGVSLYAIVDNPTVKVKNEVMLTGKISVDRQYYKMSSPVISVTAAEKDAPVVTAKTLDEAYLATAAAAEANKSEFLRIVGVAQEGSFGAIALGDSKVSAYYIDDSFKYSTLYGKTVVLEGYLVQYKASDKDFRLLVTKADEFLPLSESFNTGIGAFTVDNKVLPEGTTYVWAHSTYNNEGYMKASSYLNKTNCASDSYLISPEIDLTGVSAPVLTFEHALNNLYGGTATDHIFLCVKEVGASEWTTVAMPTIPAGTSYDYLSVGDISLSDYSNKKIQIAFRYVGTTSCTPTWQIRRVKVQ